MAEAGARCIEPSLVLSNLPWLLPGPSLSSSLVKVLPHSKERSLISPCDHQSSGATRSLRRRHPAGSAFPGEWPDPSRGEPRAGQNGCSWRDGASLVGLYGPRARVELHRQLAGDDSSSGIPSTSSVLSPVWRRRRERRKTSATAEVEQPSEAAEAMPAADLPETPDAVLRTLLAEIVRLENQIESLGERAQSTLITCNSCAARDQLAQSREARSDSRRAPGVGQSRSLACLGRHCVWTGCLDNP